MAPTFVHYRKVINNVGYRFALPALAPPSPIGDLIDIEVALFIKDPSKALYEQHAAVNRTSKRTEVDDSATLDVAIGGVLWLLPLLPASANAEIEYHIITARRMPDTKNAAAAVVTSPFATAAGASTGRATLEQDVVRAAHYNHYRPHPWLYKDEILAEDARATDAFLRSFKFNDDDNRDADSDEESDAEELGVNLAYGNRITRTRYVDVLHKGDAPVQGSKKIDPRLENPLAWTVNVQEGTWYRRTHVTRHKRNLDFSQLMWNGLPCLVKGNHIDVWSRGFRAFGLEIPSTGLVDGAARFKLVSNKGDYSCQPAAASAYASYILNHYSLVVKQADTEVTVYAPHGEVVEKKWDYLFRDLAEYSSAQLGRSLLFSEEPRWGRGAYVVMGFGVRLRDGGARQPLKPKKNSTSTMQMHLPGLAALCDGWATFGSFLATSDHQDGTTVDVRLPATKDSQDIVLRVAERANGDYDKIEYALRASGSVVPIKDEEWQVLDSAMIDEVATLHILNAARLSFGRHVFEKLADLQTPKAAKSKKARLT